MTKQEAVDKYMQTPTTKWPFRMKVILGELVSKYGFCGEVCISVIEKWHDETFKTEES